jgi:hypothetical protein
MLILRLIIKFRNGAILKQVQTVAENVESCVRAEIEGSLKEGGGTSVSPA